MTPLPRHLLPDNSTFGEDGSLEIGGCRVTDLVAQYGTPLFIYDEAHLRDRCREAFEAFGEGVAYASKAFLCKAMARIAHEEGLYLDVATGGELAVALSAGVPGERLVFHGNNKSGAELQTALTEGVGRIVVDSFDEIERLETLAQASGAVVPVLLRVTPGVEAHTHEFVMTGQDDSKFGFTLSSGAATLAVERVKVSSAFNLLGIHFHIGSQVFVADFFRQAVAAVAEWFNGLDLDELSIGGGAGVSYIEGDDAPTISEWGLAVKAACAEHRITARVTAEPGRSIAAAAAITVYTVGTIKELPGIRTYLSVDGGMSDNPRPVLYGSGYETFDPLRPQVERSRVVTMVGKHCESGDLLVREAKVPTELKVGDLVATPVTGAYGFSMASNYNKVLRPPIVFVLDGDHRLVVRRETVNDLLATDLG